MIFENVKYDIIIFCYLFTTIDGPSIDTKLTICIYKTPFSWDLKVLSYSPHFVTAILETRMGPPHARTVLLTFH